MDRVKGHYVAARGKSEPSLREGHIPIVRSFARLAVSLRSLLVSRSTCAAPAAAETLVVPLTGKRVRDIETAQLFHTLFHDFFLEDDATTYVQTGDIPAMWLRDSSAQTIPYIRFQSGLPDLARAASPASSSATRATSSPIPYANAFEADYHVWERKWEVDSLAWPVVLASVYWRSTRRSDRLHAGPAPRAARRSSRRTRARNIIASCSRYRYPVLASTPTTSTTEATGMIWGAFRPSDDARAVSLQHSAERDGRRRAARHRAAGARRLATTARWREHAQALGARVQAGIQLYGRFYNAKRRAWMYAYETDGFGRYNLMDDANIPNLTTLPYIDWCSPFDPTYLATRDVCAQHGQPVLFLRALRAGARKPAHAVRLRVAARHHRARADRDVVAGGRRRRSRRWRKPTARAA